MNKVDTVEDEELLELVEMELRDLLTFYKCACWLWPCCWLLSHAYSFHCAVYASVDWGGHTHHSLLAMLTLCR